MNEAQVDNVSEQGTLESGHESDNSVMNSDDFFGSLENSVNAGIIEKETMLSRQD